MRLQSEIQVNVKNKIFRGALPLICLPLVANDKAALLEQTAELIPLNPDLLEWRIDGYDQVEDLNNCLETLKTLKAAMSKVPLIFTCRIHVEGGCLILDMDPVCL